jgi:hypothetical protein
MTVYELAAQLAIEMMHKSGVREYESETARQAIIDSSLDMAAQLLGFHWEWEDMPTKFLVQEIDGTPPSITFRDSTDFSPTTANDLRHASAVDTEVQLDLTSVANAAARMSAKVDLGENRAELYAVRAAIEIAATPTAGNSIDLFWAPSQHATAANGNPGAVTGSDAAYTGYSSNLTASLKQLIFIGSFICTAQATGTIQVGEVGRFSPPERYGSLIVVNNSGAALHSDAVEMVVVFDAILFEAQ